MNLEKARKDLAALQRKMSAYNHAQEIIYFDGATTAPKGTAENRAVSMSVLSEESYKLCTCRETVDLLEYLDSKKEELSEKEQRMVYLLLKDIRSTAKIPMDEYVAYQELLVTAEDVWHTAKEKSDFAMFEPYLKQVFDTNIKFAGYIAPEMDPYDYWLNEYEEGLDKKTCDEFFEALRSRLVPLIKKIGEVTAKNCSEGSEAARAEKLPDKSILFGNFPVEKQRILSDRIMDIEGLDKNHIGLAETEHPFTTSIGSHHDVRITTHYYEDNAVSSMYSVIHEGGHALYDAGSAEDLAYTVLDGGISMGIHESQSRFYENIIGRSKAFCKCILPVFKELFPQQFENVSAEDFYKAVNAVEPSLIRTEADEVTYSLHILIRYELEKKVMAGELSVHDLPAEWNRLYKEYLGVDVPDDKRGVLQDTHWSGGAIGYFPSYALGSAYGAQFLRRMGKDAIDVEKDAEIGDFSKINKWLGEQIWQHGKLYTPKQLLDRVLGEAFDPNVYLDYLEAKCCDIYGI